MLLVHYRFDVFRALYSLPATYDYYHSQVGPDYVLVVDYYLLGCDYDSMSSVLDIFVLADWYREWDSSRTGAS